MQDTGDDFDWNVSNGSVTEQMSPDADHTPGIHLGYSRMLLKLYNILLQNHYIFTNLQLKILLSLFENF